MKKSFFRDFSKTLLFGIIHLENRQKFTVTVKKMDANQMPNNDNIAARRDARRRKILENSKSRLTKITGREHTEEREKSNSM